MPRVKSNLQIAAEWLWSNRGKDIWLTPATLTRENPDASSPNLTGVEAISVCKHLEEKGMIFRSVHDGREVFFLHESKEQEWRDFIADLENPRGSKAKGRTTNEGRQKRNPTAKKKLLVVIAEIIGVGIFGRLSSVFSTTGDFVLALWAAFIAIAAGLALVAHFIALSRRRRKKSVWAIYSVVLFLVAAWFLVWSFQSSPAKAQTQKSEEFAIISRQTIVQTDRPRTWLVWNNGERVASPIHMEMWVQFTNLKDTPLTLNSYEFEGRTRRGDWVLLSSLDPNSGRIFFLMNTNFDLTRAVRVDYGKDIFHSLMQGKVIGPHETVTGAVFLESPTNELDGSLRLRVRDAADLEFVQPVRISETNYLDSTIQWGTRTITGEFEDISKYPKISYGGYFRGTFH